MFIYKILPLSSSSSLLRGLFIDANVNRNARAILSFLFLYCKKKKCDDVTRDESLLQDINKIKALADRYIQQTKLNLFANLSRPRLSLFSATALNRCCNLSAASSRWIYNYDYNCATLSASVRK